MVPACIIFPAGISRVTVPLYVVPDISSIDKSKETLYFISSYAISAFESIVPSCFISSSSDEYFP